MRDDSWKATAITSDTLEKKKEVWKFWIAATRRFPNILSKRCGFSSRGGYRGHREMRKIHKLLQSCIGFVRDVVRIQGYMCEADYKNSVTHRSLVVLRLCGEEAVDLLHSCHLDLQVGQVPHNPVQVVGDLHGDTHTHTHTQISDHVSTIRMMFISTVKTMVEINHTGLCGGYPWMTSSSLDLCEFCHLKLSIKCQNIQFFT